jgi:RimJ/RimL family protein N-acetyltransferase
LSVADPIRAPAGTASWISAGGVALRPWREEDLPALEAVCGDPDICRFTTIPLAYGDDQVREWLERQHEDFAAGASVVFAIEAPEAALPVGAVWVFAIDEPGWGPRIGCWIAAPQRSRGLGSMAVALLASWTFRELAPQAIYIDCERENRASRRGIEKVGAVHHSYPYREVAGEWTRVARHVLFPEALRLPPIG